jgi:hypothetical protein
MHFTFPTQHDHQVADHRGSTFIIEMNDIF